MDAPENPRSDLPRMLRDLHDAMHEGNIAVAKRLSMNSTDAAAIEHISLAPTAIGPAELGVRLGVTKSSATEIVDRLVAAGHLQRVRDEHDRRRFRLVPTELARESVAREIDPLVRALESSAARLSDAEVATVVEFLRGAARDHRRFAHDPARSRPADPER